MKDNRPVNLDIGSIRLPITAWVSIVHRVTGVLLFAGVAVLLCLLEQSLSSPEGFEQARQSLQSTPAKLLLWAIASLLAYHSCIGVKHLIMDIGIGETMEGGVRGARIALAATAVLVILAGVWLW